MVADLRSDDVDRIHGYSSQLRGMANGESYPMGVAPAPPGYLTRVRFTASDDLARRYARSSARARSACRYLPAWKKCQATHSPMTLKPNRL